MALRSRTLVLWVMAGTEAARDQVDGRVVFGEHDGAIVTMLAEQARDEAERSGGERDLRWRR